MLSSRLQRWAEVDTGVHRRQGRLASGFHGARGLWPLEE